MNSDAPEGSGMIEALAWLEVNKKRLAIGAVIVLVVGFGIYVAKYLGEQKEAKASAALVKLRPPVNGSTNQPPVPASEFLKVAEEYSGTQAAERALILAAGAYFTAGKYPEAQAQFERLLKEHPSSEWAAAATYGVATSLEAQGKRDEALTAYQRVITSYQTDPVANDARMALGRIYEAKNQPQDALKQYEDISRTVGSGGMTMRSQEAMLRKDQLLKKFPELAKPAATNAPPSAMGPLTLTNLSTPPAATNKPATAPVTNKTATATNPPATAPKP